MYRNHDTQTVRLRIACLSLVLALSVFLPQCAANRRLTPTVTQATAEAAAQEPAEPPQKTLDRFNAFLDRV